MRLLQITMAVQLKSIEKASDRSKVNFDRQRARYGVLEVQDKLSIGKLIRCDYTEPAFCKHRERRS